MPSHHTPAYINDQDRYVKMSTSQWASKSPSGDNIPGQLGSPDQRADRDHELARRHAREMKQYMHASALDEKKAQVSVRVKVRV